MNTPILICFTIVASFVFFGKKTIAESLDLQQLKSSYPERHFQEIRLSLGLTHYESIGEGPTVVLVHGVSGPLAVWDKSVSTLVSAGYRVVRYDLYGRGFSDRLHNSSYSLETYLQQLEELIEALRLGPNLRLVGSSFGSIIAAEFTLHHPNQVDSLILIGPAGFPIKTPVIARLRDLPVVGNLFVTLFSFDTILKQNDHYFVSRRVPTALRPYIKSQLSIAGTTDAILKTMKNSPVQSFVDSYKALGKTTVPVGLIWGREDATFPYENSRVLIDAVPSAQFVTIENSAHLPQYERYEKVNPALVSLLKANGIVQ